MLKYENQVLLNKKHDVERKDIKGNLKKYSNERICSFISSVDGSIRKIFKISVGAEEEIDLDLDRQDIRIVAYDSDFLAHLVNGKMTYFINPDDSLYDALCSFESVLIPKRCTNSKTDITLTRTLLADNTVSLVINNINLDGVGALIIDIGPDDISKYEYYILLNLYERFQDKSMDDKKIAINDSTPISESILKRKIRFKKEKATF